MQTGLTGRELLNELAAVLREQLGIERVERAEARDQSRPLAADVRGADRDRVARLMLDRQVPLLRIRQPVRVNRAIERRILAVQKARIEERRAGEVLRRTVAQSERGAQPSLRAGTRRVGVDGVR